MQALLDLKVYPIISIKRSTIRVSVRACANLG